MAEHTPIPWAIDPDHRPGMGWNAHVVEASDPNNRVCFMTSGPEGKINAAFIVLAANNHDTLVQLLKDINAKDSQGYPDAPMSSVLRRRIEAVLALMAGSKQP